MATLFSAVILSFPTRTLYGTARLARLRSTHIQNRKVRSLKFECLAQTYNMYVLLLIHLIYYTLVPNVSNLYLIKDKAKKYRKT